MISRLACSFFAVFQHTATRRWLRQNDEIKLIVDGFNTQPPEGGCAELRNGLWLGIEFQHTATRRWLRFMTPLWGFLRGVSTHSHPKVAAVRGDILTRP